MSKYAVTVFLNREEDDEGRLAIFARFRDEVTYQAGDKLESVFSYEVSAEDRPEALARVWSDFNRGSPTFVGDEAYPQRSLSMGDVVEVDGKRFSPVMAGWKEVE